MPHPPSTLLFAPGELQRLLECLHRLSGLPCALLVAEGQVLVSAGRLDVCGRFAGATGEAARGCGLAGQPFPERLQEGHILARTCPHGLVEYATPITLRGRHLATLLVGPFLHAPPDEEAFRGYAREAGLEEEAYLAALRRVPAVSEERVRTVLELHAELARLLATLGLERSYLHDTRRHVRQSEQRFRAIANHGRNWEDWIGPDGKLIWVSPAIERIGGYRLEECLDMPEYPMPLVAEEDRVTVRQHIQAALEGAAPPGEIEFRIRGKRGETLWGLGGWRAIHDGAGAHLGCRGSIQDITARKQAQEESLARARQIEAAYHTAREITQELDLRVVLQLICLRAAKLAGAEGGGIFLWHDQAGHLVPHTGFQNAAGEFVRLGEGLVGRVAERRQGLAVDDYAHWADAPRSPLRRMGIGACWAEPLLCRDALIGVIVLWSRAAGPQFSRQDPQPLKLFAAQAAIALENARLYDEVKSHLEEVRALSSRMMVIREEEATRIARDLHDEVGQSLTSILLGVQALRSADDPAEMRRHADVLRALTARSLDEIRRVIRSLRPPALDEVGLLTVLRRHLSEYGAATGLRIDVAGPGLERAHLPPDVSITLFRIAQEAITNVAKHARAQCASVTVTRRGRRLVLLVEDDGCGFDVAEARRSPRRTDQLGLVGMEERAALLGGTVRVESAPGRGTTVLAEVPLEPRRPEHGIDQSAGG
jgi:PAS domain S-box-containing protein